MNKYHRDTEGTEIKKLNRINITSVNSVSLWQ